MAQDRLNSLAIAVDHTDMLDVYDCTYVLTYKLLRRTCQFACLYDSHRKQYGCFSVK